VTSHYTCSESSPFSQPVTVQVGWDAPQPMPAGQATAATVDITVTMGSVVTWALGLEGVASVEGSGEAAGVADAPGKNSPTAVRLTVPRTEVPASGPMTVHATGSLPRHVFDQPGHTTINLANDLAAHMIPRDASGNVMTAGESDFSCALDPGQNAVMLSFDVRPIPAPPTASATREAARPIGGTSTTVAPSGPTSSAATSTAARPTATPTITLGAKSDDSATGFWHIGPTVLGLVVTGMITGLLWLKRRSRATGPAGTPANANHGRDA
jgi:hypothetical protein